MWASQERLLKRGYLLRGHLPEENGLSFIQASSHQLQRAPQLSVGLPLAVILLAWSPAGLLCEVTAAVSSRVHYLCHAQKNPVLLQIFTAFQLFQFPTPPFAIIPEPCWERVWYRYPISGNVPWSLTFCMWTSCRSLCMLSSFISTTQARVIWEEETPIEKMSL